MQDDPLAPALTIKKGGSGGKTKLITVMEQLAKAAKRKLHFQEYNKAYYENNKQTLKRPQPVPRATTYKKKAIVPVPVTYTGTPETWELLTNKQRYRVVNAAHIKSYASHWNAMNKKRTPSSYKKQYRKRGIEYKRNSPCRTRVANKLHASRPATKARLLAHRAHPANRELARVRRRTHASRINAIEKEYVTEFLRKNTDIQLKSHLLTSTQMDSMLSTLLDSKTPTIVDNLHGLTLRQAFVDRQLYASMYIWLARDSGITKRPGQSFAEAERFILRDPRPVLVNGDTGQRYRATDSSYRDIQLVTIPLATFDTACACSAFETKLQTYFDTRRFGVERMWRVCGAGKLYQKLRRCDINAIEKSGNRTPTFTCGISYINNVRIQGLNSENFVTSIRSGTDGQLSKVQQPAKWLATYKRDLAMFGDF